MAEGKRNALWSQKQDELGNVVSTGLTLRCAACDKVLEVERDGDDRVGARDEAKQAGWDHVVGHWYCEAHTGKPGAGIRRY